MIDRKLCMSVLSSGGLVAALVIATRIQNGADKAGRAAVDLVMPVALIWLLLFSMTIGYFLNGNRRGGFFFLIVWLAMTVTFNGQVASKFFSTIERPPSPALSQADLPLRAVVTLGGAAAVNGFGVDEVTSDGERIVSAAQLWHAGQTRTIICTGMSLDPNASQAGPVGKRLLISLGVPEKAILVVGGEDTESEMLSVKEFLSDPPDSLKQPGKLGLITSAFHMNRALRKAKQVSLEFEPFPVAYRSPKPTKFSLQKLIPTAEAGEVFRMALKEKLAKLLGK